jgi:hypothetical protein
MNMLLPTAAAMVNGILVGSAIVATRFVIDQGNKGVKSRRAVAQSDFSKPTDRLRFPVRVRRSFVQQCAG